MKVTKNFAFDAQTLIDVDELSKLLNQSASEFVEEGVRAHIKKVKAKVLQGALPPKKDE